MSADAPPPAFPVPDPKPSADPELPSLRTGLGAAYISLSRCADVLDVTISDLNGIAAWMRVRAREVADTPLPNANASAPGGTLTQPQMKTYS